MKNDRKSGRSRAELEQDIEQLRRSLEKVQAERDRYAGLYDSAPAGYFILDHSGFVRSVNLTGAGLLGATSDALEGRDFRHFVAPEDGFLFANFLRTVFSGRMKQTCRLRLSTEFSPSRHVRIEGLVTPSGEECLAVLVDITEKRRAEQALSESEYNLAKAQAMTHVGSWSYKPATGEVRASAELLRILRLNPEETTQEAFGRVVHPDDREEVIEHLRLCAEQGRGYEIEHRLLFEDGSLRWVYTIVEPAVTSVGKVVRLYGTTQDITQRKQAEVDLANKTNELQTIFDSIGDGIIVYDEEGAIQHHNLISPRLFPDEVRPGTSCQAIFHPDSSKNPGECPVEMALKGARVDTSMVSTRDGKVSRYLDITATPIRDALGEKNRALVFFRDVSEKRLQEMQLIQAEKMSSIGVLATGTAHEINNPLTSVAGCAEALLRRFRDEPELKDDIRLDVFPHYLEVIVRESYRCKDIIDNLLSFGRKSDGRAAQVDLNRVLLELLELLRYQPSYRHVEVITDLQTGLPMIFADPSALRQVFMNLLVNAFQAIEERGQVRVTTLQDEEGWIAATIRDTGCGMEPGILDRIWEPFFTTKDVGKGVGLGLALTYGIVKRQGGRIMASSRVGEGSQFRVLLPVARA